MVTCFRAFLILICALSQAWADLADFDAVIAQEEADDEIFPTAKLTSAITLDGTAGVPFNFGSPQLDVTIEFIVSGDVLTSDAANLAVGSNSVYELRFDQVGTDRLGFTHLGVLDYQTSVRPPKGPTHVCYRWDRIDNSANVNTMEIYINGQLMQSVQAPGFVMPKGNGALGGRLGTSNRAMKGRIDRVVVHNSAIEPALIRRHACAFLSENYQSDYDPISIHYDASEGNANPVSQGWYSEEVTASGSDINGDAVLDGNANVGLVSGPAWQIYDQRSEAEFDAPRYHHPITKSELNALYENGWTFTAEVRAVGVSHDTSSFVGWQFRQGSDPGYGIGSSARVGFHFYETAEGEFVVNPTFMPAVNLGAGSGSEVHTIKAVALPRSPAFEWFVDDVSQGYLDLRDFAYGSDESVMIGANSSGGTGDGADWFEVSLASGPSVPLTQTAEGIAREVRGHDDSLVGDGVDGATGSYMRAHDLLTVQGVREVDFPIYHDSRLTERLGPLGYGWSHPYEARLECYSGRRVVIHWDAHRLSEFAFDRMDGDGIGYYTGLNEDVQYAELVENAIGSAATFPDRSWRLTLLDGSIFAFARETGRLLSVANSANQGLDMGYDSGGRLISVQEKFTGAKIDLAYNDRGLLSLLSDPLGREVHLRYDDAWRLQAVPSPKPFLDGLAEYPTDGFIEERIPSVEDGELTVTFDVSEEGYVGSVVLGGSIVVDHEQPEDLSFKVTSPSGTVAGYTPADIANDRTFKVDHVFDHAFNGENRQGTWTLSIVDQQIGSNGLVTGTGYLSFSAPLRETQFTYAGNRITAGHDAIGDVMFSCAYDNLGRIVSQDDGREDTPATTFSYTDLPGGTMQTQVIDPLGHAYTFVHDAGLHLLSATNPLGHQVLFSYDSAGNRTFRTDARGNRTTFVYNSDGDLISVTDPAGNQSTFGYSDSHFVNRITDTFVESDGSRRTTTMNYIGKRMTSVSDAAGNQDLKQYHDSTGKLKKVTLADGGQIAFDPNPNGPIESASDPNNPDSPPDSVAAFDLAGRMIKSKTRAGHVTDIAYNAVGDVVTRTDPEGNTVTMVYDHRGRRTKTIDKRGIATTNTFDGNNNLLTSTNALGATTTYTYDVLDRLVQITNALGQSVRYQHDAIGRRIATTDSLGRTSRTEYDGAGNVTAQFDSRGVRTLAFTYNSRDLVTKIEDAYGHEISFTYDSISRRTSMTDAKGRTTTYHYDKLDRPTGVTDPLNRTSNATYEEDDVLNTLQAPGAAPVTFTYSNDNHLSTSTHANGDKVRYLYNGDDQVTRISVGNRYQDFDYDSLGRLLHDNVMDSAGTPQDLDRRYLYDANSNLTTVESKQVSIVLYRPRHANLRRAEPPNKLHG